MPDDGFFCSLHARNQSQNVFGLSNLFEIDIQHIWKIIGNRIRFWWWFMAVLGMNSKPSRNLSLFWKNIYWWSSEDCLKPTGQHYYSLVWFIGVEILFIEFNIQNHGKRLWKALKWILSIYWHLVCMCVCVLVSMAVVVCLCPYGCVWLCSKLFCLTFI